MRSMLFALVASLGLHACASRVEVARPESVRTDLSAPRANSVVASVAGVTITLADLDKEVAGELARQMAAYEASLYETRLAGLNALVDRRLLEAEAKARGTSPEALLAAEVDAKVTAPGEAELLAFYEENKAQMQGATFEDIKGRIAEFLGEESKKQTYSQFVANLKKKHGAKLMLEPPRVSVEAKGPSKGPADAKVTIVIFSDFECPFCARALPAIAQVEKTYGKDVRFVFRHYPLPFHEAAGPAAEASSCAAEQGKFWELHDHIFETRELGLDQIKTFLATQSGFDSAAYDACMSAQRGKAVRDADLAAAEKAGVDGTPAFFINGVKLSGAQPFDAFQAIIDAELAR
jgi:protein-disulfide isomerase